MKTYRMSKDLFRNMLLGRTKAAHHMGRGICAERAKIQIHLAVLVKSPTALKPLGEKFYIQTH